MCPCPTVRAVAFGDFGYSGTDSGQHKVFEAVRKEHEKEPFQLGLTLGDNFYPSGVSSVSDPVWKSIWEPDYGTLGIRFFATLGNHDYRGNVQAAIDYTKASKSWMMPNRYYTFGAGPVRFFALDTDEGTAGNWLFKKEWSEEQANWLRDQLRRHSTVPWKIVYGHHPIYSYGHHGDDKRLQRKLLPILREHKAIYLAGHEHDLQVIENDGMRFFVVGGGGKDTRSVSKGPNTRFAASQHGFLDLTATPDALTLRIIGMLKPDPEYSVTVKREPTAKVALSQ